MMTSVAVGLQYILNSNLFPLFWIEMYYILLTILIQQFYNTVVVILNNVKPNGIPLHSEILCCMWYTLALMDLMMVRVD